MSGLCSQDSSHGTRSISPDPSNELRTTSRTDSTLALLRKVALTPQLSQQLVNQTDIELVALIITISLFGLIRRFAFRSCLLRLDLRKQRGVSTFQMILSCAVPYLHLGQHAPQRGRVRAPFATPFREHTAPRADVPHAVAPARDAASLPGAPLRADASLRLG